MRSSPPRQAKAGGYVTAWNNAEFRNFITGKSVEKQKWVENLAQPSAIDFSIGIHYFGNTPKHQFVPGT